ncbi:MAG: hypothetical protein AB7O69_11625 [Burkholderiales bacterium]
MKTTQQAGYIRIDAHTLKVNKHFLNELVDFVGVTIAGYPEHVPPILLVVEGPQVDIDPIDSIEVWKRAAEKGAQRTKIAYVISGRPFTPVARFIEIYTMNRGIQMRFFDDTDEALQWLV